ncbi:MAG TPA: FKBP-type peptidyl-prolyl cis-trans isomerase [Rhodanobacteraceae bacterium]|nr:FKBP-type peptidyl-prolyl cis-trans isomerase [Rhodanobacteraceae bacterium]
MKVVLSLALVALLTAGSASAQDTSSEKGKLSYSIGYQIGNDFVERKMNLDINTLNRAIQDGYAKRNPVIPEATMTDVLTKFQKKMMTEAKAEFDKTNSENKRKSAQFMAENRTKKGIIVLPSGVQYRIIEDGHGKQITPSSEVTLHYRGSLSSGLEFDSSFARGQPVKVKINEVIKGWQDVLPKMKVGDHWQVFIPPDLAYGERGSPPRIGPSEALVFDIKIIDVK